MTRARELSRLANANALTIDSNNNVGVGSTVPDVKLDVGGDAHIGAAITMYSSSGIVSATSFYGDGAGLTNVGMDTSIITADLLEVTGISTFSGDLNLGGSANVRLGDTNAIYVGQGNDLRILHSGGDSVINHAGTDGQFAFITSNEIKITNTGYAKTAAIFKPTAASELYYNHSNAASELYYNHSKKLETTTDGVTVTGDISITGDASVTGTLSYEDVTNIDAIGIITAQSGVQVGAGQSFGANGPTAVYYGDGSNLSGISAGGITTEAFTSSGIVTAVRLSTAQDHKITATGITTITSSEAGTEGESHTIRIVNSGIATVGFSTYFLFPSGSTPTLPTADGAISLISFTVHDSVGAGCTQLLAGASVNFS
jgi:hypothetical protein